jgi:hypothetical protein
MLLGVMIRQVVFIQNGIPRSKVLANPGHRRLS